MQGNRHGIAPTNKLRILAGYFMIASAIVAWYVASALMMPFARVAKAQPATAVAQSGSAHAA